MPADKPHKAFLKVELEVYELNDNNECRYQVKHSVLEKQKLKPKMLIEVEAEDRLSLLKKIKKMLNVS